MRSLTLCSAVAALLALAVALLGLRLRQYRRQFRSPSRRDDFFNCRGEHVVVPIAIASSVFELPAELPRRGQTAFLGLRLTVTPLGHFRDPFIEVRQGALAFRQYFERGASGLRHLNLSPLFHTGAAPQVDTRVELRGESIRWKHAAQLVVFEPPPVRDAEILVLAPHPDDAEIAAFGMYSRHRAWVVAVTAGEGGMADLAVVPRGARATRWNAFVRVWDSHTVPLLGGVPQERCINLVYPDNQILAMYQQQDKRMPIACESELSRTTLRAQNRAVEFRGGEDVCSWTSLVEELRVLLEKTKPDIVICPHPLVDGHPDHIFTTVALEQAARQVQNERRLFFLYVVHRRDMPMYPFGSPTGLVSFPPWSDQEWLADSIYSHSLRPDERTAKYFAVEANHDLRTYSAGEPRMLRQAFISMKREVAALLGGTALPPASFIRRAPRPNEIYSVVSAESLSQLVERAVARYCAATS